MLKEVVEVIGLPLSAVVIASRPDEETLVIRAGTVPSSAVQHCNQMLRQTREMVAAGRWK